MKNYQRKIAVGVTIPLPGYSYIKQHWGEINYGGIPLNDRRCVAILALLENTKRTLMISNEVPF